MENQLPRVFDFMTGAELEESLIGSIQAEEDAVIEQGSMLETLTKLPGWVLIEDFLYSQIEGRKDKLVDAKDLDEIRRQQSFITAFSMLLGTVETMIRESQELRSAQSKREQEAAKTP